MTVNELLSKMSSFEIIEWLAFYKIESESKSDRRAQQEMLKRMAGMKGRRAR